MLAVGTGRRKTINKYLSDNLIGTLNKDLHWPPVVISHLVQKPLKKTKQLLCGVKTDTSDPIN